MIIHELSHNKLNLLNDLDPLLDPERHGDGWGDRTYYSPWRNDQRPLKGILHGLFVFVAVAAFWADRITTARCGDEEKSKRRFKTIFAQLEVAFQVLSAEVRFTDIGTCLFKDLFDRIEAMHGLASEIDGDQVAPLYAELQDDPRFENLTVNEAIRLHRKTYGVGLKAQTA